MTTTALYENSSAGCESAELSNSTNSSVTKSYQSASLQSIPPDYAMANRFLDALTGRTDESITYQFFDDQNKKNKAKATWKHMKRSTSYLFLQKKQREGCGVYAMVNRGDGMGRSAKNVVDVRALFIDLDGTPWELAADMLKPHIRVESSKGRWHLYWLVSDCAIEQFKPVQQAIAKKFNGDKSCVDLSRVLRVPGFYHLKNEPVMSRLVEVNNIERYAIQEIINGLELESNPSIALPVIASLKQQTTLPAKMSPRQIYEYTNQITGELIDLALWSAKNPSFDIIAALNPGYALGSAVDGKQHIRCPFAHEHTDSAPDLATFIANSSSAQFNSFAIHCMHDHCIGRDRLEFLSAMLNNGWLSFDTLKASSLFQKKRPLKIYLHVQDVTTALEWTTLSQDEFRIALHLAVLMWSEDDGMLPDDNWKLARCLGLPENHWLEYRQTLIRSGWLLEKSGRIANAVTLREFENAQTALMKAVISGQKGGFARAAAQVS